MWEKLRHFWRWRELLRAGDPPNPDLLARQRERENEKLHLSVDPLKSTKNLEGRKGRKISKKAIEYSRGLHRGPVLQTITYKSKDGHYLKDRNGELIPEQEAIPGNEYFLTDK